MSCSSPFWQSGWGGGDTGTGEYKPGTDVSSSLVLFFLQTYSWPNYFPTSMEDTLSSPGSYIGSVSVSLMFGAVGISCVAFRRSPKNDRWCWFGRWANWSMLMLCLPGQVWSGNRGGWKPWASVPSPFRNTDSLNTDQTIFQKTCLFSVPFCLYFRYLVSTY